MHLKALSPCVEGCTVQVCLKALSPCVEGCTVQVCLKALSPCVEGCTGVFKSALSVCRRLYRCV